MDSRDPEVSRRCAFNISGVVSEYIDIETEEGAETLLAVAEIVNEALKLLPEEEECLERIKDAVLSFPDVSQPDSPMTFAADILDAVE